MKLNCSDFTGVFFLFVFISHSKAQQFPDSVLFREATAKRQNLYFRDIADNAQIYHGIEYIRNGQHAAGYPFFESDSMLRGYISYDGTMYPEMNLQYDLLSNQLLINNYEHDAFITLSPEKVDSFQISGHVFIRLNSEKVNGLTQDGYYEQLYSGEPALYVKREKRLIFEKDVEEPKYIQYNNYYIRLNHVYHKVDDKNALLDVFNDRESEMKKYMRANKLNFKKNLESSLVLSTIYYSRLKY